MLTFKIIYEYLTTAAGVLLIGNWNIILASKIKNRNYYPLQSESGEKRFKMFFAPYNSYLGIVLVILALIGAAFDPIQRIGLFASIGIVMIISLSYKKVKSSI